MTSDMITILQGDWIEQLRTLPDASVHCCVTSPPYWGLRDYGVAGQLGLEKTPDCGRPLATLKSDLSVSQAEFVHRQLLDAGLLDAYANGMGGIVSRHCLESNEDRDEIPTASNDEPEGGPLVCGNPGNSNRPESEPQTGTPDKQGNCNPSPSPLSDRPANSGGGGQQGDRSSEVEYLRAEPQLKSPASIDANASFPSRPTRCSASTGQSKSCQASSVSQFALPKSSPEHLAALQHCDEDLSKSHGKSYRKTGDPARHNADRTAYNFAQLSWAWFILPQEVLPYYQNHLCGQCYVCKLVEGFREVRRVLRDDGTCWINLGDSYATGGVAPPHNGLSKHNGQPHGMREIETITGPAKAIPRGLKPKDMCGIPWMVAFALRADGWYLRSDIIWHKPNPMPESVTDRPTKAHEYIFLLSKRQSYFYDAEAIKEPRSEGTFDRFGNGKAPRKVTAKAFASEAGKVLSNSDYKTSCPDAILPDGKRNKRTVWIVPSQPYPACHFATFPEDLIKPCILAGTSAKGCCPKCGAPWERVVKLGRVIALGHASSRKAQDVIRLYRGESSVASSGMASNKTREKTTVGWQPTCECSKAPTFYDNPPNPCTVLDPFGGSGTTGQVAIELGRKAILIELNPKYVELIERRTNVTPGLALA